MAFNMLHKAWNQWNRGLPSKCLVDETDGLDKTKVFRFLIIISIIVLLVAMVHIIGLSLLESMEFQKRSSIPFLSLMLGWFITLYVLSSKGREECARFLFVLFAATIATAMSMRWGISTPQALLMHGLAIALAGILLHSKIAIVLVTFESLVLVAVYFEQRTYTPYLLFRWKTQPVLLGDVLVYAATLAFGGVVSWLSNRQTEKLFAEKTRYAQQLKQERDLLEQKVKERTQTLYETYESFKSEQQLRFAEVNKLAALGKMTTGLIHDIANPLTYVSTTLGTSVKKHKHKTEISKRDLQHAKHGLQEIASLIESVRLQLQKQTKTVPFSVKTEVERALLFLQYKAWEQNVVIQLHGDKTISIVGDPAKFHQIVTNIVLNAIEAYPPMKNRSERKTRIVEIDIGEEKNNVLIKISDSAGGIDPKNYRHIFHPFFTTKEPKEGTGVGLAVTKEVVETAFCGQISFKSQFGIGTQFVVTFPKQHDSRFIQES